jgi:hypothetical protein
MKPTDFHFLGHEPLMITLSGCGNDHCLGSDAGGQRAAAIYSLLGTAKLNGLDPELYLRCILEKIADHPINRIHELLPWKVTNTHTNLA